MFLRDCMVGTKKCPEFVGPRLVRRLSVCIRDDNCSFQCMVLSTPLSVWEVDSVWEKVWQMNQGCFHIFLLISSLYWVGTQSLGSLEDSTLQLVGGQVGGVTIFYYKFYWGTATYFTLAGLRHNHLLEMRSPALINKHSDEGNSITVVNNLKHVAQLC